MRASFLSSLAGVALIGGVSAHMSTFSTSMYGMGGDHTGRNWIDSAGDPVIPIGPNLATLDEWFFRGPAFRALAPPKGEVTALPAGGRIMMEISCNVAWTSYGWRTTIPGSPLDSCPDNSGVYHSGDPTSLLLDDSLLSGCALAIANVDNIEDVTMDNLVVFSTQAECVKQKETYFDIPAMMPACDGEHFCAWFWLSNVGTANFFMTGFDCNVTGSNPLATAIAAPQDPTFCMPGNTTCVTTSGAKRPLYAYNSPTNCAWPAYENPGDFNANRPGYHSSWSFSNGAQNDIFVPATVLASPVVGLPPVAAILSSSSMAPPPPPATTTKASTSSVAISAASSSTVLSSSSTSSSLSSASQESTYGSSSSTPASSSSTPAPLSSSSLAVEPSSSSSSSSSAGFLPNPLAALPFDGGHATPKAPAAAAPVPTPTAPTFLPNPLSHLGFGRRDAGNVAGRRRHVPRRQDN